MPENYPKQKFLQGLVGQAQGTAPSEAALAQKAMLAAAQRRMLQQSGAPGGVNPALAQMLAARGAIGGQVQAASQGAGMRFNEQAGARRALFDAETQLERMAREREMIRMNMQARRQAANSAMTGSIVSGLFGLGGTALSGLMGPSAPAAPAAPMPQPGPVGSGTYVL